jgi:hypothetical protein
VYTQVYALVYALNLYRRNIDIFLKRRRGGNYLKLFPERPFVSLFLSVRKYFFGSKLFGSGPPVVRFLKMIISVYLLFKC